MALLNRKSGTLHLRINGTLYSAKGGFKYNLGVPKNEALLDASGQAVGYKSLPHVAYFEGEIYELYLRPEFQGLGFGRRLFTSAKRDLVQSGLKSMVILALSDNEPAVDFYRTLGGRMVARSSESFGSKSLDKVAFAWNS